MYCTFAAAAFFLTKGTIRQTHPGIVQQCSATGAQLPIAFPMSAIYPDHLRYSLLLPFNPCHFVSVS